MGLGRSGRAGPARPGAPPSLTPALLCLLSPRAPQRLTAHLHSKASPPYVINLDPAVHELPFPANIGEKLGLPGAEEQTAEKPPLKPEDVLLGAPRSMQS